MNVVNWQPPLVPCILECGWVHVYRFGLDLSAADQARAAQCLSTEEQARSARYLRPTDRQRFAAGRGQMRQILSVYCQIAPEALQFHQNPQGKPALVDHPMCFNLSHSSDVAVLAVTHGQAVGIDLETNTRQADYTNIARRFFAPSETEALLALTPTQQAQAFLNIWTRKEAYIKALGVGLSIPLDSFTVSLGEPAVLSGAAADWNLLTFTPSLSFTAALVVDGPIQGIRWIDWPGSKEISPYPTNM